MYRGVNALLFCLAAGVSAAAHARDCPKWESARPNLLKRNYTIEKLSPIGVGRVQQQIGSAGTDSATPTGYFARVTEEAILDGDGHRVFFSPADKAIALLYSPTGTCVGYVEGSIEQLTEVLDGSAKRLRDALDTSSK